MPLPIQDREEYRTASELLRLCIAVREELPRRHEAGEALLVRCGYLLLSITSAFCERTRRACALKLVLSQDHVLDVGDTLRSLTRRRRAVRAYATAAIEIAERLTEQLNARIDQLQNK